jgi:fumarate hydratase class II
LGPAPKSKVDLIVRAAQEVSVGRWDAEFPLVVFQTGSFIFHRLKRDIVKPPRIS